MISFIVRIAFMIAAMSSLVLIQEHHELAAYIVLGISLLGLQLNAFKDGFDGAEND